MKEIKVGDWVEVMWLYEHEIGGHLMSGDKLKVGAVEGIYITSTSDTGQHLLEVSQVEKVEPPKEIKSTSEQTQEIEAGDTINYYVFDNSVDYYALIRATSYTEAARKYIDGVACEEGDFELVFDATHKITESEAFDKIVAAAVHESTNATAPGASTSEVLSKIVSDWILINKRIVDIFEGPEDVLLIDASLF